MALINEDTSWGVEGLDFNAKVRLQFLSSSSHPLCEDSVQRSGAADAIYESGV